MTPIHLHGCRAEPLLSYLSGLGVVRLVAEQLEPEVSAGWDGNHLVLATRELTEASLIEFFATDYRPTPLIAPWNGRGGFQDGQERPSEKILRKVESNDSRRLEPYRKAIKVARKTWEEAKRYELITDGKVRADRRSKARFVELCRARFPDEALAWLDTSAVLLEDNIAFPLILGTGGNIGSMDISFTFLRNLDSLGLLSEQVSDSTPRAEKHLESRPLLRHALLGDSDVELAKGSTSQFDPGGLGGPNSSVMGDGTSLTNPWSFVLAMEGATVFASAAARRLSAENQAGASKVSMPFTVAATVVGYGSAAESESPKGELWAPLWRDKMSFREIRGLISEGRSQWGRNQARSGLDFVRAAATLGVDRSVDEFVRYLISVRNGKDPLAVPIGRYKVADRVEPGADLLRQLDRWVGRARFNLEPVTVSAALIALDRAQFSVATFGGALRLQTVLTALADVERAVSRSPQYRDNRRLEPISGLSAREWLPSLDDGSAEFRVAVALAFLSDRISLEQPSLSQTTGRSLANLLRPVTPSRFGVNWSKLGPKVPGAGRRTLFEVMLEVFGIRSSYSASRSSSDMTQEPVAGIPFAFDRGLSIDLVDIGYLLSGQVDEKRLGDILAGLLLLDWKDSFSVARECLHSVPNDAIARSHVKGQPVYTALVPFFVGRLPVAPTDTEPNPNGSISVRPRPEWIGSIRAGVPHVAAESAARLLRGYGWKLITDSFRFANIDRGRLATALLLHIDPPASDQWQMRSLLNHQCTTGTRALASHDTKERTV